MSVFRVHCTTLVLTFMGLYSHYKSGLHSHSWQHTLTTRMILTTRGKTLILILMALYSHYKSRNNFFHRILLLSGFPYKWCVCSAWFYLISSVIEYIIFTVIQNGEVLNFPYPFLSSTTMPDWGMEINAAYPFLAILISVNIIIFDSKICIDANWVSLEAVVDLLHGSRTTPPFPGPSPDNSHLGNSIFVEEVVWGVIFQWMGIV